MEAFKTGFQKGKKRAQIKKVIEMIGQVKTDEDKKEVVEYMNKNGLTADDIRSYMENKSMQ